MTQELKTVLNEVEQKLYTMAYIIQDEFTEEEKQKLKQAWCCTYGVINNKF